MATQEIIIPISKKKLLFFIFTALVEIAFGGLFLFFIAPEATGLEKNFMQTIGAALIIIFSCLGILLFRKMFNSKPGLIINEKGIWHNPGGVIGEIFIDWKNVLRFDIVEIMRTQLVIIKIKNAEELIHGCIGLKQKLLKYSYKNYGSPISISSNTLKCNFETLVALLQKSFEEAQKR